MTKRTAGWAFSICLAFALVGVFVWSIGGRKSAKADEEHLALPENPIGNPLSRLQKVVHEPTISDRSATDRRPSFAAPTGRYADSELIDRADPFVEGEVTVVRFMVSGTNDRIERILVEERYIADPDTGDWLLMREAAYVGDEIMIDADPIKINKTAFDLFVSERNLGIVKKSRLSDYLSLKLSRATIRDFDKLLLALRERFPDTLVSEDHLYYINAVPNDYNAPLMWNLDQIGASDAWRFNTGSLEVIVGVVDTGVLHSHPDLKDNIWRNPLETPGNGVDDDGNGFIDDVVGWDFHSDDADPTDASGHGTHIAGTIGAVGNNGVGTVGLNWNVKIIPIRVGEQDSLSSSAIAEGLRYLRFIKERGENVIASNNSYGSSSRNFVAEQEVRNHRDEGILFVAASGNSGDNLEVAGNAQYPAQFNSSNVIAVANSTQEDVLDRSSNYGVTSVHIAAPGKAIYSTYVGANQYATISGTSMSTPLVVGAAALLKSYRPTMSAEAIKSRLLDTVDVVPALVDKVRSGGRLNARNALQPELVEFDISVSNHPGAIVFLPESGTQTTFEIDTALDATVTASLIEPNSGATIETREGGKSFDVSFSQEGSYMIRFVADLLGVDKVVDRLVVVGFPSDVTSGLKHEWSFEGDSTEFLDTAGMAHATVQNATRVSSPMGIAANFSGSNSKASFDFTFFPRVTISGFVRNENLLSSEHPRITHGPNYYLYFSSDNRSDGNSETLKFLSVRSGGLGVWNANPRTAVANQWMHVMATYDTRDTSNVPDMYINGVKQRVRAQNFPDGPQDETSGTSYLGDREDGTRAWDGQFDEVRIYDAPLSEYQSMALSSRYLHSLWREGEIVGGTEIYVESVANFVPSLSYDGVNDLEYRWFVSGPGENSYVIESQSASGLEVAFLAKGSYVVDLEVAAPESTFSIRKEVEVVGEVAAGVFVSDVGIDGRVWLEVNANLTDGFVTYFSPSSSIRLIREPISIDETGLFETGPASDLSISGQVDGPILGRIEELNVDFVSDMMLPIAGGSGFVGTYRGGGVDVADEYFDFVVFETGSALLFRSGETVDVAQGSVQTDGEFTLSSLSGALYTGTINLETGQVSGRAFAEDEFEWFLHNGQSEKTAKFVNLSTRGFVSTGEGVLIGGFVVNGQPRQIMARAVGPTLSSFNVSNVLSQPRLELFKGSASIATSEAWGSQSNAEEIALFASSVGAFELPEGSSDAAMLNEMQQGIYTVMVRGVGSKTGNALLEVYDSGSQADYDLANVSTRGNVDGNRDVMIAGFVIRGSEPKKTLVRVVGPGLSEWISEYLEDPFLTVYKGEKIVATNDNWSESLSGGDGNGGRTERIAEAARSAGAFPVSEDSKDAATVLWLKPGIYSVIASGVDSASGIALVEVYELR